MYLIRLVVAGQGIHHEIDAEAPGHFALALAAGQPGDVTFQQVAMGRPRASIAQAAAKSFEPISRGVTPS